MQFHSRGLSAFILYFSFLHLIHGDVSVRIMLYFFLLELSYGQCLTRVVPILLLASSFLNGSNRTFFFVLFQAEKLIPHLQH